MDQAFNSYRNKNCLSKTLEKKVVYQLKQTNKKIKKNFLKKFQKIKKINLFLKDILHAY